MRLSSDTTDRRGVMAIDQYGNAYHDLGPYPRKALLERFDRKRAEKVYVDTKDGEAKHIGYRIAGRWFRLYFVTEWAPARTAA